MLREKRWKNIIEVKLITYGLCSFFLSPTAISSSSDDDSDEGTDEEIKSEESDIDEQAEMVCSCDVP